MFRFAKPYRADGCLFIKYPSWPSLGTGVPNWRRYMHGLAARLRAAIASFHTGSPSYQTAHCQTDKHSFLQLAAADVPMETPSGESCSTADYAIDTMLHVSCSSSVRSSSSLQTRPLARACCNALLQAYTSALEPQRARATAMLLTMTR
jgi:hypothetical protein